MCQGGARSISLFYSGHGSQVPDGDGDELDGYDESLCPVDYQTRGKILDVEINATIVRPLPHGVKLHAIIDTCSSGTMLDLPFICRMNRLEICLLSELVSACIFIRCSCQADSDPMHGKISAI